MATNDYLYPWREGQRGWSRRGGGEEGVAEAGEAELGEMGVANVRPLTHSSTHQSLSHTPLTEKVPCTLEQEPNRNFSSSTPS